MSNSAEPVSKVKGTDFGESIFIRNHDLCLQADSFCCCSPFRSQRFMTIAHTTIWGNRREMVRPLSCLMLQKYNIWGIGCRLSKAGKNYFGAEKRRESREDLRRSTPGSS